ncbi:TAXI family TRAP transporter solute-binding subunit [Streptomyces synnematoformans]|uniref:TAXI family TRAP transporter solute-binding subunit n=1 Tax=Streptomyces synnematoformans TaxID=415721 RepID=A0ABP5JLG8_9ACTN
MVPSFLRRPGRRRTLQAAVATAAVLGLLLWWLLPLGGDGRPDGKVVFATGVRTGVYAEYGRLLREGLARDEPGLDVRLHPSEGSIDNLRKVTAGRADFAVAAADSVATYRRDRLPGWQRLRAVARLYDDYVQLVVLRDSPVRRTTDLRGLRVGVGEDGSGVQLITRRLLSAAGLDFDRDVAAVRMGLNTMPKLLREGEIDAFFWSGGLPTEAVERLAGQAEIELVPLGDLLGALHAQGELARYYRAAVMPPDAYPTVQRDTAVPTLAVANLLVTTEREDSRLTESVTSTVIRDRDRIGRVVHAAQRVDLRTAVFTDPLELHEGAARYYREQKP